MVYKFSKAAYNFSAIVMCGAMLTMMVTVCSAMLISLI